MSVKPIPEGYRSVTPYLVVKDAAKAIDFYVEAFGAVERFRLPMGGRVGHAELMIGDSIIMMADECEGMSAKNPLALGGTPVSIHLYVTDVDKVFKQALAAGGNQVREPQNQFYGDRSGALRDPFGHMWNISTHVEDVPPAELQKRVAAMGAKK